MKRHHVQHDGFEQPASLQHVVDISATRWHFDDIWNLSIFWWIAIWIENRSSNWHNTKIAKNDPQCQVTRPERSSPPPDRFTLRASRHDSSSWSVRVQVDTDTAPVGCCLARPSFCPWAWPYTHGGHKEGDLEAESSLTCGPEVSSSRDVVAFACAVGIKKFFCSLSAKNGGSGWSSYLRHHLHQSSCLCGRDPRPKWRNGFSAFCVRN